MLSFVKFCKVVGLVLVHPLPFVAPFDVKFCKVVGLVSAGLPAGMVENLQKPTVKAYTAGLSAGMVALVGVCCRLHQ
ncbi:hypothetical protein [Limosilactobacillus fermentum]|uniref:hypothetical protein n=1 Tax=Limosilactobacillus fermentum TaxID=1613 RepID=UPI00194EAD1F|nr:hypothetical protein [Limosilactobacillus fermentum]